jgi:hypothetical protein
VIVIPGDPYLVPATHGAVEETWEVTSAVSIKETKVGFDQLRELNLRVGRACQKAGALWEQSDQPVITTSGQAQIVVSRNIIRFKYMP